MTSPAELVAKLDRLANGLDGPALRLMVTRVGVAAKRDVDDAATKDLGPDRQFSGWKRARLTSGFEIRQDSTVELRPRPSGVAAVAEEGRRPGAAAPRRRRAGSVLVTPWGPRTYTRESPLIIGASPGLGTWSDAAELIAERTPGRVHDLVVDELRKVF